MNGHPAQGDMAEQDGTGQREPAALTPQQARQGRIVRKGGVRGRIALILAASLILAVVAMAAVFFAR